MGMEKILMNFTIILRSIFASSCLAHIININACQYNKALFVILLNICMLIIFSSILFENNKLLIYAANIISLIGLMYMVINGLSYDNFQIYDFKTIFNTAYFNTGYFLPYSIE
jgi:hypothetical protein